MFLLGLLVVLAAHSQLGYSQNCFDYDTDYYGNDISATENINSAGECQTLCQENDECTYFTWVSPLFQNTDIVKKCHLKNGQGEVKTGKTAAFDATGLVSGPRLCSDCFDYDTDYYGNDISAKEHINSAGECQTLCQKNDQCTYFTWVSPSFQSQAIGGKCHLKNGQGEVKIGKTAAFDATGLVSGPRVCPDCIAYDTDYQGDDISAILDINSAGDCQTLCQGNNDCTYFTWVSTSFQETAIVKKCHLKNGQGNVMTGDTAAFNATGLVSGRRECLDCFDYDTDYQGDDISAKENINSAGECQIRCQKNDECTYFTWVSTSFQNQAIVGKCHLKNGQGEVKTGNTAAFDATGLVSGPRVCSAVPDCKTSQRGGNYMGSISKTSDGVNCMAWTDLRFAHGDFPDGSAASASNFCRNPDRDTGPWCYYTDATDVTQWGYCDIPLCPGFPE